MFSCQITADKEYNQSIFLPLVIGPISGQSYAHKRCPLKRSGFSFVAQAMGKQMELDNIFFLDIKWHPVSDFDIDSLYYLNSTYI